jgi:hypothetical protein
MILLKKADQQPKVFTLNNLIKQRTKAMLNELSKLSKQQIITKLNSLTVEELKKEFSGFFISARERKLKRKSLIVEILSQKITDLNCQMVMGSKESTPEKPLNGKTKKEISVFKGEIGKLEKVLLRVTDSKVINQIKKLIGDFESKIECLHSYPITE